jgi:hypothetical protein
MLAEPPCVLTPAVEGIEQRQNKEHLDRIESKKWGGVL